MRWKVYILFLKILMAGLWKKSLANDPRKLNFRSDNHTMILHYIKFLSLSFICQSSSDLPAVIILPENTSLVQISLFSPAFFSLHFCTDSGILNLFTLHLCSYCRPKLNHRATFASLINMWPALHYRLDLTTVF